MREKKKKPLKIVFLGILMLLVIGGSIYCISHHSLFKDKLKEETKKTIEVDKSKENDDNTNKEREEEQKVEEKGEESNNKNNETKVDSTPKTNNDSSPNQSSNNTNKNNVTNNQNNNKIENAPNQESPKQEEPQPVAPSCTPKKFDMNFIRADFSNFGECTQMGDKYKEAGYGYFCDNYQDDCGTTYYMLTIYERNTGKEYDYHTIQLP